ncbi:hypothetical protein BD413DRAFT_59030 [Trametes elegans]|nr:hypothetical protein BD413DRAFT_59030 [Trametes elegans]
MAVDRAKIAAAAQRNVQALRKTDASRVLYTPYDDEHEVRLRFRRLIDYGILEGNKPELALESLQTVLRLAERILEHPSEERFRRINTRNERSRRLIMQPKGVLQLMVNLGFREKTIDFETCYVFSQKNTNELRVGASMIKEVLARERGKFESEEEKQERQLAERRAHEEQIMLHFLDDRKSVAARAQRERHSGVQASKGIPARKPGTPRKADIVTIYGTEGK